MQITITLQDNHLSQFAGKVDTTSKRARTEMQRGMIDAGRKTTTQVRQALKKQMNVRRYGVIVQATRGFGSDGGLGYTIQAFGKGLPIREFKTRVTSKGVSSTPWGVQHLFKRSFASGGKLRARLGASRFPIRSLYGPSPSKELVKDASLATFQASTSVFMQSVVRRLTKLMP